MVSHRRIVLPGLVAAGIAAAWVSTRDAATLRPVARIDLHPRAELLDGRPA